MMPSWLTLKLGGMIAGAALVVVFVLLALHWRAQAADRKASLETICAATRAASGQPKLKCADVPRQIAFMGEAISTYAKALDAQSEKVAQLGTETKRQQELAAKASTEAAQRAKQAGKVSDGLQASSRASERLTKPCEPSKALTEAWQ